MLRLADVLLEPTPIQACRFLGAKGPQTYQDHSPQSATALRASVYEVERVRLQLTGVSFSHTSIIYAHFNCVKVGLSFSFHLDKYS